MPSLSFSPSRCMQESQEIAETRKPNPLLNYCAWKLHMMDPSLREATNNSIQWLRRCTGQKEKQIAMWHMSWFALKKWQYSLMWNLPFHITIMPLPTSSLTLVQPFHSQLWNNNVFVCLSTRVCSDGRKFTPHINIVHLKIAWNSLAAVVVEYYCSKSVDLGPWPCD